MVRAADPDFFLQSHKNLHSRYKLLSAANQSESGVFILRRAETSPDTSMRLKGLESNDILMNAFTC